MKYLWIGVGNSHENQAHILNNGGKILSASVSNDALVLGLDANGIECDSINCPDVQPFPLYPEKSIQCGKWSRTGNSEDCYVGYNNRKYISIIAKQQAMVKEAKKWALKNKDEQVVVFVYQMASRFLMPAVEIKKIIPTAKIILIVPDLPQYMDMNMGTFKKVLKKIDWFNLCKCMKSVDKYVLYSKYMAEFLKLRDGSWTVMEGSYNPDLLVEEDVPKQSGKISVMYSGVLDLRYGIKELLDAMELLDEKYELWFTGAGNAVDLINERATKDIRIKNWGYLPSRYELLKKQREATMLISTRSTEEEASKYCFPSKIFEYMVSGNPVISTRIGGIPNEYFDYLIPIEKISAEEISKTIKKVGEMSLEDRNRLGRNGRNFVLEIKNSVKQAEKILQLL